MANIVVVVAYNPLIIIARFAFLHFRFCNFFFFLSGIRAIGKNLEYGLKQEGLLSFVRELNGNEEEPYDNYLRDASMYARGKRRIQNCVTANGHGDY